VRMSEPRDSNEPDDAPVAGFESSTLEQLHSDPGERHMGGMFTADMSVNALRRAVARIEDPALPAYDLARPGALLGPYRIVRRLVPGAMGVVSEAEDPQLSRSVALKVLAPLGAS